MARYNDAVCRLCRREGTKLFLKGDRCFTPKCGVERRGYPPGQHGQGRARFSDFGVQLREKQKVRRMYGLLEKQFARTMDARAAHEGPHRREPAGAARAAARQRGVPARLRDLARRGAPAGAPRALQGERPQASIPSLQLRAGDVVALRERSRKVARIMAALEALEGKSVPHWLEIDKANFTGSVKALPVREDITMPIQEQLIVELYSR